MTRSATPFSYEQTFDELFEIFNKRLAMEDFPKITASDFKEEILEVAQAQFPSHELETDRLQEDIASFATAFFLPKNSALIINRYFKDPNQDFMSDIAEVVDLSKFTGNPLISFIYRGGGHFMSVVVNVEKGQVRFTNSFKRGDCDFYDNAKRYLLPVLNKKFDKQFTITTTPQDERVEQIGDATTCNFHSMLNNIIRVLEEGGVGYQKISVFVSSVLGVKIAAENIQDLIKGAAEQFASDEQKANLQKRMVCAAQIYRRLVGEIYPKSTSNTDLENLVKDKSKSDAFLTGVLEILDQDPKYQKLTRLMLEINSGVSDVILSNNFSLNPDLSFDCDKDELKAFVFSRESMSPLKAQGLLADAQEVFEMIDVFYLSIGEKSITEESLENAVQEIKKMDLAGLTSEDSQHDSDKEIDGNELHKLFDEVDDFGVQDVEALLGSGADVINQKNESGDSPFHIACSMSVDIEIIKLLINRGANLNSTNSDGQNGLDILIEVLPNEEDAEYRLKGYGLIQSILNKNIWIK